MKNNNTIGRLNELLEQISDQDVKKIVSETFEVEISFRSADRINFPKQKIRQIIEDVARQIENKGSNKEKNL